MDKERFFESAEYRGPEVYKRNQQWHARLDSTSIGVPISSTIAKYIKLTSRIQKRLHARIINRSNDTELRHLRDKHTRVNCHKTALYQQRRISLAQLLTGSILFGEHHISTIDDDVKNMPRLNKKDCVAAIKRMSNFPLLVHVTGQDFALHSFIVLGVDEKSRIICFEKTGYMLDFSLFEFKDGPIRQWRKHAYDIFAINPTQVTVSDKSL